MFINNNINIIKHHNYIDNNYHSSNINNNNQNNNYQI